MKRKEFDELIKLFKIGDRIKLDCRGNYGNYRIEGQLRKVEDGRVYLDVDSAHSYRRIINISGPEESDEEADERRRDDEAKHKLGID